MERDSHETTSMVNQIFWKKTSVRCFTASATSLSLEIPLPLQKRESTRFLNHSLTPGNTACVDGYPRMVDEKKQSTPRRKFTCKLKSSPLKRQGKSSSKPSSWGSMLFFRGVEHLGQLFHPFQFKSPGTAASPRAAPLRSESPGHHRSPSR